MKEPVILILAAGKSSRMRGADKLMELVEGKPLLAHLSDQALKTGLSVYVALPQNNLAARQIVDGIAVNTLLLPKETTTEMSATIRYALNELKNRASHIIMMLGDMPEIDTTDLQSMIDATQQLPDLVHRGATASGNAGHPVIFPQRLFENLLELTGDFGAKEVLKTEKVNLVALPNNHATTDLDTPEEWQKWRAL
ncbi:MAG: nucleotidyltransferase family protein [Paracoccaceae bacterium]|nr:nucleotidyltransferase family protein [Paracoccaceae bacterium]